MDGQLLFNLGAILFLAGFLIVFAAVLFMFLTNTRGKGKVKGGGAVIIGPFPIVFETDRDSLKILLVLSIALIVLMLIVTLIFRFVIE